MTTNLITAEETPDPGDYTDFLLNLTGQLEDTEVIELPTVVLTVLTTGLGWKFDGVGDDNPVSLDVTSKKIVVWASIDILNQDDPEFDQAGIVMEGKVNFTTSPQGRKYERSFGVNYKQR
ncbi:MAG: hypothetical protein COB09_18560 [Thalassobium sp.]|nr:MAG: hypothetical protein COB09_18560 [Thalassobium sp.]